MGTILCRVYAYEYVDRVLYYFLYEPGGVVRQRGSGARWVDRGTVHQLIRLADRFVSIQHYYDV